MEKTDSYILIADSGSTKTDWLLKAEGTAVAVAMLHTQGINPIHQSDDVILGILRSELASSAIVAPHLAGRGPRQERSALPSLAAIRFYGAGVRPDQEQRMEHLLRQVFPQCADIQARSDMLGAARALLGHQAGLACILGTGANSCLYDGERIVANTPALGYILGDEGSGAVLGRCFLNALYKGRLYEGAAEEFEQTMHLTMGDVIDRVYRQPMANRWLASLAEYVASRIAHPEVEQLVVENFRLFIRHNLQPYRRPDLPVSAVGSIAFFFRPQLQQAAQAEGYHLGKILRSPIDGL